MNQMVNKKNNNNKNSSNSLVFGRWPHTKIKVLFFLLLATSCLATHYPWLLVF